MFKIYILFLFSLIINLNIPDLFAERNEIKVNSNSNNNNSNVIKQKDKIIERKKRFVPIKLVKAVDTRKFKKDSEKEEAEEDLDLEINNEFPSESLLEQEQMSKYDKFKFKVNNEKNVNLSKIGLGKVTMIEAVAFFTNLLIYPAIFFQVWQTYMTQEAEDIRSRNGQTIQN